MNLCCVGISHHATPVEVRERFAISPSKSGEMAHDLRQLPGVQEALILSTCNRTEYYALLTPEHDATLLQDWARHTFLEAHHPAPAFYTHQQQQVAHHLCEVVCGLDSMVLGETEIFGQVKKAYQSALGVGATGRELNRIFQTAFRIGKKVRTQTTIQNGQTSVGSVAVDLAETIFGALQDTSVMLIGAGEMSRLTAKRLRERGARSLLVTNRSLDNARQLAAELDGEAFPFDSWHQVLPRVDVIISSTGAPHSVIHPEHIEGVRRQRKYRPLFLIDIALPRDIDPAVGDIEEAYLYDLDSLQELAREGLQQRTAQIARCRDIIQQELADTQLPPQGTQPSFS